MAEFAVVVDGVVRFLGTFDEAHHEAQVLRGMGERPVVRRAQPDDTVEDTRRRRPSWEDDDPDVIPF